MAKEWIVPDADLGCDGAYFDYQELVRCGECKHWSQTDTMNGKRYGQCLYPHTVVRSNCFVQESFYCADGEREVQE